MRVLRLFTTSILLSAFAWNVSAEYTPKYQRAQSAIAAAFPEQKFSIWANAEGDLNGDGIQDLALMLTGWEGGEDARGERLVILTGNPDQSYSVLSVSGEFCNVRKFYNLDINGNSLFVQGFSATDATGSSSGTLQFRYNAKLKDLELIGREDLEKEYEKESYYKVSVNYLTKTVIHSRREKKRHKEAKAPMNDSNLFRLQGFDCATYDSDEPSLYIDKDFSVKKR